MDSIDEKIEERKEFCIEVARSGAETALNSFRSNFSAETKEFETDFVTEADITVQRQILDQIQRHYSDDTLVGEEENIQKTVPKSGVSWIVDPIDGTTNFLHGSRLWATCVALTVDGSGAGGAIVAPALNDTYLVRNGSSYRNGSPLNVSDKADLVTYSVAPILQWTTERDDEFRTELIAVVENFGDLRRIGSAQMTLARVATGAIDVAFSTISVPNPWDTVIGVLLVRQAGGRVTDIYGNEWTPESTGIIATNGHNHEAVIECIRDCSQK